MGKFKKLIYGKEIEKVLAKKFGIEHVILHKIIADYVVMIRHHVSMGSDVHIPGLCRFYLGMSREGNISGMVKSTQAYHESTYDVDPEILEAKTKHKIYWEPGGKRDFR